MSQTRHPHSEPTDPPQPSPAGAGGPHRDLTPAPGSTFTALGPPRERDLLSPPVRRAGQAHSGIRAGGVSKIQPQTGSKKKTLVCPHCRVK